MVVDRDTALFVKIRQAPFGNRQLGEIQGVLDVDETEIFKRLGPEGCQCRLDGLAVRLKDLYQGKGH
jgi:hypothetical protein